MTEIKEAISRIEKEMKSLDGSITNKYWIIQGLHKAWEICHKVEENFKQQLTDCDFCGQPTKYEEGSCYCNNHDCGNKGIEL